MNKKAIYFYITAFSIFLGICGPYLFLDGMFMDGLLYATISKNLANGIGTFWYPHLTNTLFPVFHEHPPLAFGIQSICFSIFGSSIYIERFYSFTTFIIVGLLIVLIWKKITGEIYSAWIPLFFWIAIPLVTWACKNNMLENTMSIFVCASALFYLMSLEKHRLFFLFISGFFLFLGLLSKGFVSLFIWSFPFWIWLCLKKITFKRMLIDSILIIGCTILPLILLFIFSSQAFDSLQKYFYRQVVGSISNVLPGKSRFFIVLRLMQDLLINIGIAIAMIIISKCKKPGNGDFLLNKKTSITFFLLGLSGVLPIMCSMKQSGFYMLSTFPFFAIAFGLLIKPTITRLLSYIDYYSKGFRIFTILSYCMLIISITLSIFQINHAGRDKKKIDMIYDFIKYIPNNSTIRIHQRMWTDWSLHGYFGRYANISLDPAAKYSYELYLVKNDFIDGSENKIYKKMKDLNGYSLYKKK